MRSSPYVDVIKNFVVPDQPGTILWKYISFFGASLPMYRQFFVITNGEMLQIIFAGSCPNRGTS